MEHASDFHVSPFDENGDAMFVKQEDKDKWDTLWRMESDAFDAEMLKEPAYKELANRMFSTWDGNQQVITWTQVSMSPEKTNKRAWHPRVRCVIICPPVHVYKAIEVAMHNLNASSHATVQYDWIQDAERCRQVLSTPLNAYKAMIGDDVYEEFEKSRLKAHPNKAWYDENMTTAAHVVFKYVTIVNPQLGPEFLETVRELHDQLAKIEKSKREISYSVGVDRVKAFASAGIHNALKLELLRAHYGDVTVKAKFHHPESNDVDDDIRPWLAQWSLWSALELISRDIVSKIFHKRLSGEDSTEDKIDEAIEKFRLYFVETRDNFWSSLWFPVDDRQDVNVNIKRAKRIVFRFFVWHLQVEKAPSCFQKWREVDDEYSMYKKNDTFSRDLDALSDWEILNCPWWIEQRTESPKFVADAETLCWEKIQKEEEPFDVSKDNFEDSDKKGQLEEARHLEPSPNIDGLVVDTSRTKKQKESKMKKSEDVEDEEGQTPKGKPKPAKNLGSGKHPVMWRFCIVEVHAGKYRRKKNIHIQLFLVFSVVY
ncbi:hypothetical protein R1sor_021159 [Riccia sorocarpa]|uniref:Uncharacterized protein n=1 Tax=Riccia sorocarpa TaxID=122646 RepID=A0ABD3GH02_9MARC